MYSVVCIAGRHFRVNTSIENLMAGKRCEKKNKEETNLCYDPKVLLWNERK